MDRIIGVGSLNNFFWKILWLTRSTDAQNNVESIGIAT